jgi:SAM-dependent methyltransferase
MASQLPVKRDEAFEAAVVQLRRAPENYTPPEPDFSQAQALPEDAFTQRIQWLAERIPARSRLLDLGCGRGEILHFLSRRLQVNYLGLEREPEHLVACHRIGVRAIPADFNNLSDLALRHACSQRWETVLIIDSLTYWRCPAVVLAALQDRCQRLFVTVNNAAQLRHRCQLLLGNDIDLPNTRGSLAKGELEFSPEWFTNRWTVMGFQAWCEALGYAVRPVARRSVSAKYLPLGLFPGLFARSVLFELTPEKG